MRKKYYAKGGENPEVVPVRKALEQALYKANIDLEIPDEYTGITGLYPDNIRVNKLAYALIDKYDMPVLRTWYKYGQYQPYEELRAKSLDIGPVNGTDEYIYSSKKTDITVGDLVDAILEFDLKQLFDMDIFEFLETNYKGYAPEKFKDIYLASTEVIRVFEDAVGCDRKALPERVSDWRYQFQSAALDMKCAIRNAGFLPEYAREKLIWFLNTVEDSFIAIECSSTPSDAATELIRDAREYYHDLFWPIAAMSISIDQLDGPDKKVNDMNSEGKKIRERLNSDADRIRTGWKKDISEKGLVPSPDQRRSVVAGSSMGSGIFDAALPTERP